MKKFAKSLLSTAVFLTYASKTYATEKVTEGNSEIGKIALLGIGVVLIALVLFIGYKLDSIDNAEPKPKKEKVKKEKAKKQNSKNIKNNDEVLVEDIYKTANEEDVPYEIEENEKYEKDKINLSEINENVEYTEDGDEESLFESVSKVKGYDTFIDDEDDFDEFDSVETKKDEKTTSNKTFDSTMVFDTNIFSSFDDEEENNDNQNEKEYNGLDDFEFNSDEKENIIKNSENDLFKDSGVEEIKQNDVEDIEDELEEDIDIYKFKPQNEIVETLEKEEIIEIKEDEIDSKEDEDIYSFKSQYDLEDNSEEKEFEEIEVIDENDETEEIDLDSKIDELDDYVEEEHDIFGNLPNVVSFPPKKYDEEIDDDFEDVVFEKNSDTTRNEEFLGFSTGEIEESNFKNNNAEQVSNVKRFTRKKSNAKRLTTRPYPNVEESSEDIFGELPNVVNVPEEIKEETKNEAEFVDYNFLAQMEENLVKTKNKRLGIEETKEDKKKTTKKSSETKPKAETKKGATKKTTTKESKEAKTKTTKTKTTEKAKTTTKKK